MTGYRSHTIHKSGCLKCLSPEKKGFREKSSGRIRHSSRGYRVAPSIHSFPTLKRDSRKHHIQRKFTYNDEMNATKQCKRDSMSE